MNEFLEKEDRENSLGQSVQTLVLRDFRNYAVLDMEIDPGLNILFGTNAQGKTNLLESLYLVATTRLLRGSRDAEGIRTGADRAKVDVTLNPSRTDMAVVIEHGKKKTCFLNGLKLPRASDLIGRLPCVSVSAFDMGIVRNGPEERRLFMDLEMTQLSPAYLNHFAHYKRSLEHRNALLRRAQEGHVSDEEFETWEANLGEHGAAIRTQRRTMVAEVAPLAADLHGRLAPGESFKLEYEARDDATSPMQLLEAIQACRTQDIHRGSTSSGPHRDDLSLCIQGSDARHFGSQGQQRTAMLALKLATYMRRAKETRSAPLLLLDDVFSDLDEHRRSHLVQWLLDHAHQAVLTCTEPQAAGRELLSRAKLWEVRKGIVTPQ